MQDNSFVDNSRFEEGFTVRLVSAVRPLMDAHGLTLIRMARAEGSAKSDLDRQLQGSVGDFLIARLDDGRYVVTVDLKVERSASRNIFFETFSNHASDPARARLGWGMNFKADRIWYAFEEASAVAVLYLPALRTWLDERVGQAGSRLLGLRERAQARHAQLNLTVGRLVPFAEMPEAAFRSAIVLGEGGAARLADRSEFLALVEAAIARRPPRAA